MGNIFGAQMRASMHRALIAVPLIWAMLFARPVSGQELPNCVGPAKLQQQDVSQSASPVSHNALGAYFAEKKQFSCAIPEFRKSLQLDPSFWDARYNLGLALRETRDLQGASRELQQAIAEKPEELKARLAYAATLHELGNGQAAIDQYKAALKIDPRSTDALYNFAQALSDQGRFEAAVFYLRTAIAVDPKDPSLSLALALALEKDDQRPQAIQVLTTLVAANPRFAPGHFNLATLYAKDRRYMDAANEYAEDLKLEPDNETARLAEATALATLGEYKAALPLLQLYTQRKPGDYKGFYLQGMAHRSLGDYPAAQKELQRALQLKPEGDYGPHYELGALLESLGKLQEAKAELEKARELDPQSGKVSFRLAMVLHKLHEETLSQRELQSFQQRKHEDLERAKIGTLNIKGSQLLREGDARGAVQVFEESIKLDPNDAKLYFNLALAFQKAGDRANEEQALEKAIHLNPNFERSHNQLGLLYLDEEKLPEAAQEFQSALKVDPQFAEAENNLGVLYGQQGKGRDAERLFRQATEDNPEYAQAFVNLGLILAAQERYDEAEKVIESALRISPGQPGALNALGMTQEKLNRRREAIDTFRQVTKIQPNSVEAHLNLGLALAEGFNLEGALGEFSTASRLAPQAAAAHYYEGRTLLDLRRYQEARRELQTAAGMAVDPGDRSTMLYLLAVVEKQLLQPERSAQSARQAIRLDPRNADAYCLLGQDLARTGKVDEAREQWKKALKANPRSMEALYALSRTVSTSDTVEIKMYRDRLASLERQKGITTQPEMFENLAMNSATVRDWPQAQAYLAQAIKMCRNCALRGSLVKSLGLVYARSGELEKGEESLQLAQRLNPDDHEIPQMIALIKAAAIFPPTSSHENFSSASPANRNRESAALPHPDY